MTNVLHLGDERQLSLYGWPAEHAYPFPVVVRGFEGRHVHVEAVVRSDDPGVDNEWRVPFSWLRTPETATKAVDMEVDIADRLLGAQAELQTALGFYRLEHGRGDTIERRLQAGLALQHSLLADLGLPMLDPAELPDDWTPA